jgi:hypothetical protein
VPQMGHINPGWFLLFCGLVVLAAGLLLMVLAHREKLDAAYPAAPVMLTQPAWYTPVTVYTPLLPVSAPVRSMAYASPPPPLDQLRIEPPVCYDAPRETVMCLGRVFNTTTDMMEAVRLQVKMTTSGDTAVAGLEQRFIAPGSFAPYRVQFDHTSEEKTDLITSLESAHRRQEGSFTLAVTAEMGTLDAAGFGHYILTATVKNPYSKPMEDVQLIGTLSDSQGHLTGYRVQTLAGGIAAGESRDFRLEIIPQTLDEFYSHSLTVLAWEE